MTHFSAVGTCIYKQLTANTSCNGYTHPSHPCQYRQSSFESPPFSVRTQELSWLPAWRGEGDEGGGGGGVNEEKRRGKDGGGRGERGGGRESKKDGRERSDVVENSRRHIHIER